MLINDKVILFKKECVCECVFICVPVCVLQIPLYSAAMTVNFSCWDLFLFFTENNQNI